MYRARGLLLRIALSPRKAVASALLALLLGLPVPSPAGQGKVEVERREGGFVKRLGEGRPEPGKVLRPREAEGTGKGQNVRDGKREKKTAPPRKKTGRLRIKRLRTRPERPQEKAPPPGRLVALGWISYKKGEYRKAARWFKEALRAGISKDEALLGLSYARMALGEDEEAARGLETLHRRGYRRQETAKALAGLYLRLGEPEKAARLLPELTGEEKERVREEARRARLLRRFRRAHEAGRLDEAPRLAAEARRILAGPELVPILRDEALFYASSGRPEEALRVIEEALGLSGEDWRAREGLLFDAVNLPAPSPLRPEILRVLKAELALSGAPESYRLKAGRALDLYIERLQGLGWDYLKGGREKEAREVFELALTERPGDPDIAFGLFSALLRLGRMKEARALARRFPEDERFEKGLLGLEEEKAWSLLREGRPKDAEFLFSRLVLRDPTPNRVKGLLLASSRNPEGPGPLAWLGRISIPEGDEDLRRLVSSIYRSEGMPLHAASALGTARDPFSGFASARASVSTALRRRSGEKGTSRLLEWRLPGAAFGAPLGKRGFILGGLERITASAGSPSGRPWLGSPRPGLSPSYSSEHRLTWVRPWLLLTLEGRRTLRLSLSATPFGGPVGARPTGSIEIGSGPWSARIYEEPVRETLLSWTGRRDPYTGIRWGRVLRTGGSISFTARGDSGAFLTLQAGAARLRGEHVVENEAFGLFAAAGRASRSPGGTERELGGYLSLQHFSRNSNFETLGHGGYFSPSFFAAGGGFGRIRTPETRPWLLDASLSMGLLYFKEDVARVYPLDGGGGGEYPESDLLALGYSGGVTALALLGSRLLGAFTCSLDRSADYTEWSLGLRLNLLGKRREGLSWYDLDPHFGLVP